MKSNWMEKADSRARTIAGTSEKNYDDDELLCCHHAIRDVLGI